MTITSLKFVQGATVALLLAASAAQAQDIADFYSTHDLTIVVGSGAGGGYDTYARVLARHIGNHIPGNPDVIVQNRPGAGSLNAAADMLTTGPHDGTVITALFNTLPAEPLIRPQDIPVDLTELVWIGSMGKHQNICVTWGTSEVDTLEHATEREVVVAATEPSSNGAIYPQIINEMLGTQFRVVPGYPPAESHLALERGEVEGICGMSYQTLLTSQPDWIANDRLNILAQIGLEPHADMPDVPMLLDMIADEGDRQILSVFVIQQEMGRPFAASPRVPEDRIEALRTAFAATMEDPDFLAEAEASNLLIEPLDGAQTTALVGELYAMPEEVVTRVRELLVEP